MFGKQMFTLFSAAGGVNLLLNSVPRSALQLGTPTLGHSNGGHSHGV